MKPDPMPGEPQDWNFGQFLRERMKHYNLSLKRLSELSNVSVPHLENFLAGDWDELPPAPYLRGYLLSLSKVLQFDPEIWWLHFKKTDELKISGAQDNLPRNRFALRTGRKYGWLIAVAVILALYFGIRFAKIFGRPILIIQNPSEAIVRVSQSPLTISGTVQGGDQLLINSEDANIGPSGDWQKDILLQPGLNTLEVSARKFLGGETRIIRQVVYEPPTTSTSSTTPRVP